ncbi:universal stress protein [Bizionia argentinensis JUB59]|uniref:Universal stress protein n=1 Tax=Bizionia argentinensis JUB59 TaxID=1046627 RepID=G2ECE0_9FLAO|nr:universal stress protein [Bizionia argentinensis]EGV43948.1 universal stress protein [Bizionia argentinensis JUB59]
MRHHILLPTDFSGNAWSAALYAINLYADEPCTFYFSHAWTFLNTGARTHVSESYLDPLKAKSKEKLAAIKDRAKIESKDRDHKFETFFCIGSLMDSIEIAIKKHNVSLIVMGTKGATGTQEFLFGSNTVTVINKMRQRPVMLVPENVNFVKPTHIAFPTDFNRFYGEELKSLKQLADLHKSQIEIVHINKKEQLNEKQHSNLEMLNTYFKDYEHNFNWITESGKKEQAITSFIEDNDINILTMINYEHSFVENLIKEPIIKKMGFHSIIPFLVIPRVD